MTFQKRNLRQVARKKNILKNIHTFWESVRQLFFRIFSFQKPPKDFLEQVSEKMKQSSILSQKSEAVFIPPPAPQKIIKKAPIINYEASENHRVMRSWKIIFLFFSGIIGLIVFLVFQFSSSLSFSSLQQKIIISTFGEELPVDSHGLTNILVLGVGGKGHSGENLSDTMILMSIDAKMHSVSLLSLPRDLYVSYKIENEPRLGRINEVFRDGINYWRSEKDEETQRIRAIEYVKNTVTKITGYEIQRFAVVDFRGFIELIDAVGGVTIDVDKPIYDTTYPTANYGYETFQMKPGIQELDGELALKYVRSRHGSSDFERSRRQKQLISALKEEAVEKGLLTSPQKIRQFLSIIERNFWSDLSLGEMISLGGEAFQVPSEYIFAGGLTSTPETGSGGFLYTPPREEYGGASVLLPYLTGEKNPYIQIQFFAEILFQYRTFLTNPPKIEILNTTRQEGVANMASQHLIRYGIPVASVGNIQDSRPFTTVEYWNTPEIIALIPALERKISAVFTPIDPPKSGSASGSPITLYIGEDFSSHPYRGTLLRTPLPQKSTIITGGELGNPITEAQTVPEKTEIPLP